MKTKQQKTTPVYMTQDFFPRPGVEVQIPKLVIKDLDLLFIGGAFQGSGTVILNGKERHVTIDG